MSELPHRRTFEGVHTTLFVQRLRPRLVLVRFTGTDIGELGDAPFQLLEGYLAEAASVELFIDARRGRAASVAVSNAWALWLRQRRDRLSRVCMLTSTRFLRMTAEFVRRFADLGETMRVYTDAAVFDEELRAAMRGSSRRLPSTV